LREIGSEVISSIHVRVGVLAELQQSVRHGTVAEETSVERVHADTKVYQSIWKGEGSRNTSIGENNAGCGREVV